MQDLTEINMGEFKRKCSADNFQTWIPAVVVSDGQPAGELLPPGSWAELHELREAVERLLTVPTLEEGSDDFIEMQPGDIKSQYITPSLFNTGKLPLSKEAQSEGRLGI